MVEVLQLDRFMLRQATLALSIALSVVYSGAACSAGAGSVNFSIGQVVALNAAGIQRALSKGAEIDSGDTIRTGESGRAQVRFADGAMVSLQPATEFRIDEYKYSGQPDGQEKGFFSLLKGGMRTITGLIGRSKRDSYKVSTAVATIGIRGTEYTLGVSSNGELQVSTGAGQVEVCNGGGCALLAGGESGKVNTATSTPRRTESRPQLPPQQPTATKVAAAATNTAATAVTTTQESFSKSEDRVQTGTLAVISDSPAIAVALPAGVNYALATATSTTASIALAPSTAFDASRGQMLAFETNDDGSHIVTKALSTVVDSGVRDQTIGWGRWLAGTQEINGNVSSLSNLHYVVGVPTPNFTMLGGVTATYSLAGFTLPTASAGQVGQALSGGSMLTAHFISDGSATLNLALGVPIAGQTYTFSATGSMPAGSQSFSLQQSANHAFTSAGFFAGANAAFAGLTYHFSGDGGIGDVNGAAVFKR